MKKILAILIVVFAASVAISCVKPFEYSMPLALDNYDLTLSKVASKQGVNGENFHYIHIIATGPWEATISHQVEGEVWCWLEDHFTEAKKDEFGNPIKDELGNVETITAKGVEGVETFPVSEGEQTDKYRRVRGNAGKTYLPLEYQQNGTSLRYAVLRVRRLDIDYEKFMTITQNIK